jgi:hypothetical protein
MRWLQGGSAIVMILVGIAMIIASFFIGPHRPVIGMLIGGIAVILGGAFSFWLWRLFAPLMKTLPAPKGFGASMRDMSNSMANANAIMQQQNLADKLRLSGRDAQARILAVRDTGVLINFDAILDFDLLVTIGEFPPYPINGHRQLVSKVMIGRAQPGIVVPAKVDPDNLQVIYISWI